MVINVWGDARCSLHGAARNVTKKDLIDSAASYAGS
jgi:hypothetical protein